MNRVNGLKRWICSSSWERSMSDEPRIAKYGLPVSESQRFHANHAVVMQEPALFKELLFQHALRIGPGLRAALDALAGECAVSARVAQEAPFAPAPAAPPAPLPRNARRASPDGLRERLGLR
jgi:hypothetical protein